MTCPGYELQLSHFVIWFVIWLNPSCVRRLIWNLGATQSKFCSFHRGYHNDSHAHWSTKSIYTPTIVIILSNLSNFFVLTSYLLLAKWLYFGIGVSFKSHTQTNAASSNTLKREDASILKDKWWKCFYLKVPCRESIAVLRQLCWSRYLVPLTIHKNVPLELWRTYRTNFVVKHLHIFFSVFERVGEKSCFAAENALLVCSLVSCIPLFTIRTSWITC